MNVELFKHPRDCDQRITTLQAMIKQHQRGAKDGIGTFKKELVQLRARRRQLRKEAQLKLPFGSLNSLCP